MDALDCPVVLLGRGGSGTRVLSQIAQQMGIFLGNDINVSGDSVEWVGPIYDLAVATCTGDKPDPDWHVPKSDAKMGGLNVTKILGADDKESKSEDDADEASLALAKRLNADWNNIKENKKRCVNWHACTLSPKEVKNWRRKVLDNQSSKRSAEGKRKRTQK